MIERQIVAQKLKEKQIEAFVFEFLGKVSCSRIKMQRTPLGEKISVYTSRPGLIVGRKGANIKLITEKLKTKFKMENPQLEVVEITNPNLDASSVARSLISGFERFGPKRFKAMAYHALENSMKAGAKGIEIIIGGRGVPGERAKSWRFSAGYLKKSGDIHANYMDKCFESANLDSGTLGIKVSILNPDVVLPDDIQLRVEKEQEKVLEVKEDITGNKEDLEKIKAAKKKTTSKKSMKDEEDKEITDKAEEKIDGK